MSLILLSFEIEDIIFVYILEITIMSEGAEMHIDPQDSYGKFVGTLAAILAVLLSIFTILAHRSHTESIELQNETNDSWAQYQAKRIRDYQLEMNTGLLSVVGANSSEKKLLLMSYSKKHEDYTKELDKIKKEADELTIKGAVTQKKALYFDLAEGVLEISLVMSSLYFISRKKLFPKFGFLFGILGAIAGILGLML